MGRQHVHDQSFQNRPPRPAALRRRKDVLTRIRIRFREYESAIVGDHD